MTYLLWHHTIGNVASIVKVEYNNDCTDQTNDERSSEMVTFADGSGESVCVCGGGGGGIGHIIT